MIEQNSTELTFLSAYGGLATEATDTTAVFSAVKRFISAGGVKFSESNNELILEYGYVKIVDNGVKIHIKGSHYRWLQVILLRLDLLTATYQCEKALAQ